MKHALVVGGTGMLSDVSLWLVNNGYHVSIIAQNADRMNALLKKVSSQDPVTPLFVDYKDGVQLKKNIGDAIHSNGPISTVVAWIHSDAVHALPLIIREVSTCNDNWQLFHVLGSSSNIEEIKRSMIVPANCFYSYIQLGFVVEDGYSRWLTNHEISNGILEAIQQRKELMTIGQLEPWELHP